ncbi:hypothetical protein MalM25_17650 [Planctomycetes bacterium MalM25]|nr:hypothetical protein MalM25_17650 [Planctomycetes bacterium MalM25]
MRSNSLLSIGLVALTALGCGKGGGDATVEGKVTIDGFPLESGSVVFVTASSKKMSAASGNIDGRGNYKLVIGRDSDLDSGEYLAQVKSVGAAIEQEGGGPPLPGPLLTPAKYAKAETSGLRYRLRPGKNVIDIALASDPEPEGEPESESEGAEESTEETSSEATASDGASTEQPSEEAGEEQAAGEDSGEAAPEAEATPEAEKPAVE